MGSTADTSCGFPPEDVEVRDLYETQALYNSGEPITGIYCIVSGRVMVITKCADGLMHALYVAGAGDLLGAPEVLGHQRFNCTAICVEPTRVGFVPRATLLELIRTKPEFSLMLMRQICRRIDHIERAL